jgi:hypothetical protein
MPYGGIEEMQVLENSFLFLVHPRIAKTGCWKFFLSAA